MNGVLPHPLPAADGHTRTEVPLPWPTAKGLLLDLDDTLYSYEPANRTALATALSQFCGRHDCTPEMAERKFDTARREVKARLSGSPACHSRLLYFQRMLENDNLFSPSEALALDATYWDRFVEEISLRQDTADFLETAKRNAIPICLVTNLSADIQFRKIMKLGIETLIDHVVTSEEAGVEKPRRGIFDLALAKLGLPAEAVHMIGDDWHNDVVGATALGIRTYWLNPKGAAPPGGGTIDPGQVRELRHLTEMDWQRTDSGTSVPFTTSDCSGVAASR